MTRAAPLYERREAGSARDGRLNRDLIVVGASAGGVEALKELAGKLPPELPASVVVVLHLLSTGTSVLPDILSRAGPLPAAVARAGESLERGQIYVAPPDRHLVVRNGVLRLTRGPRENGHRPAIDPLFRSAARAYGPRVIGVVLSGALDDGAAGLRFITQHGGAAVVQDPEDALYTGMPSSALRAIRADHGVAVDAMAEVLCGLLETPVEADEREAAGAGEDPEQLDAAAASNTASLAADGEPASLTCPECGGALWERQDGPLTTYECRVGHSFSSESLIVEQGRALEGSLWAALQSLEERADLLRRMARRTERRGGGRLEARAKAAEQHAGILREAMAQHARATGHDEAADLRPEPAV